MRTISVADARDRLPDLVEDVSTGRSEYVGTRDGSPAAVLISVDEHAGLRESLEILSDSAAMERIRTGLAELARGDALSFEDTFAEPF